MGCQDCFAINKINDGLKTELTRLRSQLTAAHGKVAKLEENLFEICEALGMPYDDYQGEPTALAEIERRNVELAALRPKAEALDRLEEMRGSILSMNGILWIGEVVAANKPLSNSINEAWKKFEASKNV